MGEFYRTSARCSSLTRQKDIMQLYGSNSARGSISLLQPHKLSAVLILLFESDRSPSENCQDGDPQTRFFMSNF
jgi:hypothetical protein